MDRLDEVIKVIEKIKKECDTHKYHDRCPYFLKNECKAISALSFLKEFAEKTPKDKSIVLKNIDLGKVTVGEQRNKVIEDRKEFTSTVYDYFFSYDYDEKTGKYAIESFWNMVQSGIGLLQKIDVDAEDIMNYYNTKFLEKLKNRPR